MGIIILLIIVTISGAFAFYNYSKTGSNSSKVIAGDIYMRYNNGEVKSISIIPSDTYRVDDYYEFTIEGKNESDKNIIYDIKLNHGETDNTKTRLDDKYLRFRLVTVDNNNIETEVVSKIGYESINDTTIHVDTISKTNTDVSTKYRLYTWVEGVIVGNVAEANYSETQWNNVYTNIKVDVNGSFVEKTETDSKVVTFNPNGGTVIPTSKVYSTTTYGELPIPTRYGYLFDGWYLEDTFETKVTSSTTFPNKKNITLYAKWIVDAIRNIVFSTEEYVSPYNNLNSVLAINNILDHTTRGTSLSYDGTAKSITYSTSDPKVATIDAYGKIKGVSEGQATITVTIIDYDDTRTTETINITIKKVLAENVSYSQEIIDQIAGSIVTCDGNSCNNVQLILDKIAGMLKIKEN